MAAKKFMIPSLREMETSKRQEYKVKTLFDKHKTSPVKNTESSESAAKTNGSVAVKATGLKSGASAGNGGASKSGAPEVRKSVDYYAKQTSDTTSQGSKADAPTASKSTTAAPQTETSVPKTSSMIVKSSTAGSSLSAVRPAVTGVSPNRPSKTASLIVSARQRGNPLLKHIRSVPWEFSDIVADYEMGTVMCALFLSLRYHNLNPNYIHERLKLLGHSYDLRVLLVQVDTKDPHHSLRELAKICILADCTLLCAWSPEEAARYIETYKVFENKPPDMIMEKQEVDFVSRAQEVLTSGRKINRTDVLTLLSTFGSFENVVRAGEEEMSFCPGLGVHKAKRLNTLLHEPFLKAKRRKKAQEPGLGKDADVAS